MVSDILLLVQNKLKFSSLQSYIDFTSYFLNYIEEHKQAIIVSQNEPVYKFFQYNEEADFKITRPFNSSILYTSEEFSEKSQEFLEIIQILRTDKGNAQITDPNVINRSIYTMQQTIGFALDASKDANRSRKLNGDYFESLILLLFQEIGILASHGVIRVPVRIEGHELFSMNYQHDLIIKSEENPDNVKIIGSVKTTSKDRIDKIFIDKFLYSKLTETKIPHIAIFLHDVQRKNTKNPQNYGINGTFLTGHFKGYTVKLNALDGVYYFDPRPNMQSDTFLSQHIQTFDNLLCKDVWELLK